MAPSVTQERLLESKPQVPVGRSVSWGRNISKEEKACLTTSAVPSLEILRYAGEL